MSEPVSGTADNRREKTAENSAVRNCLGVLKPADPIVLAAAGDAGASKEAMQVSSGARAVQGISE